MRNNRPSFMPRTWRHGVLGIPVLFVAWLGCKVLLFGGVGTMTMTPDTIDRCLTTATAVDVRWWSLGRGGVRLWIYSLGEPAKVWMEGPRHGQARTDGKWMVEGSTLMLTDLRGHVLARRTVTAKDCKSAVAATAAL